MQTKMKSGAGLAILMILGGVWLGTHESFFSDAMATAPASSNLQLLMHLDDAVNATSGSRNANGIQDSSGRNHNGTAPIGIVRETRTPSSKLGSAVRFGNGKYIEIPYNNALDITGPLTISMWINTFYGAGTYAGSQMYHGLLTTSDPTSYAYMFAINPNYKLAFYSQTTGWHESAQPLLGPNTWQFVSVVRDNCVQNRCRLSFYRDGQPIGSAQNVGVGVTSSANHTTRLGAWPGSPGSNDRAYNFVGGMDEVAVYNRALTAEEIYTLYSAVSIPADGSIPPLRCHTLSVTPSTFEATNQTTRFTINAFTPSGYNGFFTWSVNGGGEIAPGSATREFSGRGTNNAGQTRGRRRNQRVIDTSTALLTRNPATPTQSITVASVPPTQGCNVTIQGIPPPQVNFRTTTAVITESPRATFQSLNFELSNATLSPVTITYRATSGTATAADHDLSGTQTITIPAGSTQINPGVRIINDFETETDETIQISIVSVSQNATIGPRSQLSVTVHDDDARPGFHRTPIIPAIPPNNVLLLNFDAEATTDLPRDTSGMNNNTSRARATGYFPMENGKAYEFVGTGAGGGSYLEVPSSPSTNMFSAAPREMTIEMWIYPMQLNTMGANRYILANRGGGNGSTIYSLSIENDRKLSIWQFIQGYTAKSNAQIPENFWTHIAFVQRGCSGETDFQGCTGSFYINGILDSTFPMRRQPPITTGTTVIGSANGQQNQTLPIFNFKGRMDSVAIYDRALTCTEIANRAGVTAPGCTTP